MLVRPFALVGFTYLLTLTAAVYFGREGSLFLACLAFLCALLFFAVPALRRQRVIPLAVLTAAVGLFGYAFAYDRQVAPLLPFDEKDAVVSGVLCELPYEAYGRCYYVLETDQVLIEGESPPQRIKLRLSCPTALEADVYDRVTAKVHLFLPDGGEGFDSRSSYASKGIHMLSYLYSHEPVEITAGEERPLYYYALKAREGMLAALRTRLPPEQSALVGGVLLGEKYSLSQEVKKDFRVTGVSHLLAVSGLHTAIVAQCLLAFFLFLRLPRRSAACLAALGVFGFMAVTGFVPSVVRAGMMCILTLLGIVIRRRADSLNSLGIAVLVLTVPNPFAAGDIGFLLSFAASLGLIVLSPALTKTMHARLTRRGWSNRLTRGVASALATCLSATVFTLPIVMLSFGEVSLVSPLANLLEAYPAGIMLLFGALAGVCSLIPALSFLASACSLIAGILANYLIFCVRCLAAVPSASIPMSERYLLLWLAGTLLLLGLACILGKGWRYKRTVALLSVLMLLTGVFSHQLRAADVLRLSVLDVGDGCALVLTRNGRAAVLSAGGDYSAEHHLASCLDAQGTDSLDLLLLPGGEEEAPSSARRLIRDYTPASILAGGDEELDESLRLELVSYPNAYVYAARAGATLWGNVELTACRCASGSWLTLEAEDLTVLICPSGGDAAELGAEERNADLLITGGRIAHRELLSVSCLVLSCAQESAGELLYSLDADGAPAYLTAGEGALYIDLVGEHQIQMRRDV